jgi:hypothetical protein
MTRATTLLVYTLTLAAVGALVLTLARDEGSRPVAIARGSLTNWAIVAGAPADPWVIAARPPDALVARLRDRGVGADLTALPRIALPLVLRQEFEDSLQGIYGIDRLMRLAEDAAVHTATFEPVCVAQRAHPEHGTLTFVALDAPEFWRYRADIEPFQPEQGGSGIFDPAALTPVLPIAATLADTAPWWPLKTDPLTDCVAALEVE